MNKRLAGIFLIAISALLFISRYIVAAITTNGLDGLNLNTSAFTTTLEMVNPLLITSVVCCVAGIVYLIWAERSKE